jgi:ACR3 family arsenite transporter
LTPSALLDLAGRNGRALLVLGLVVGVAAPGLAAALRPWLPGFVAAMLFLAALRIGVRAAVGAASDLGRSVLIVLGQQLVLPVVALLGLHALGWAASAPALALGLMLAAPPISGSPNLTVLTGNDPAPALRLMIVATALLPLTAPPVLMLLPQVDSVADALAAAARLFALIALATGAAFAVRRLAFADGEVPTTRLDGLSALTMAAMVVGLMSAVGPALIDRPGVLALTLLGAFAANFGIQAALSRLLAAPRFDRERAAWAIGAGNRNIALFFAALPPETIAPILLFIGCYQIPMYLTPALLGRLYGPRHADCGAS